MASNPQKLEQDYTYPVDNDNNDVNDTITTTGNNNNKDSSKNLYSEEIRQLAQSKAFTVTFGDNSKKTYLRRKATMEEVLNIEEKRQEMYQNKGTPLQMRKYISDFYWYSTQVHLRDTKTNSQMLKEDFNKVIFEDFKKIIDACEYAMLFNPN